MKIKIINKQITKSVIMYDTIGARLSLSNCGSVDLLSEIPCYLENVSVHDYTNGVAIIGTLYNDSSNSHGLCLSVTSNGVSIKEGSLCKWALGDNFQTLGRSTTQMAIENISDLLHLPMKNATIFRIDIAHNFIVKYPIWAYLRHLGGLTYFTRLEQPNGLYYKHTGGVLAFYDKIKEQKNLKEIIPALYQSKNVLRYEQRYTERVKNQLKCAEVTLSNLYDERFYIQLINNWYDNYKAIQKLNDNNYNFYVMNGKQQLYRMGVLLLTKQAGGQLEMLQQIAEAQKRGELTTKQAYDLRCAINEACNIKDDVIIQNEAICELDKKICEAVKYYR